jgi:hypothetical protein
MPRSYDIYNDALRADAAALMALETVGASLRAHEKENSLAPALVSQEADTTGSRAGGGDTRFREGARRRGSST